MQCSAAKGGARLNRINSVGIPEMGIVLLELRFYPRRFLAILYFRYTVIDRAGEADQETVERRECVGSGHCEASGGVRKACGPDAR